MASISHIENIYIYVYIYRIRMATAQFRVRGQMFNDVFVQFPRVLLLDHETIMSARVLRGSGLAWVDR